MKITIKKRNPYRKYFYNLKRTDIYSKTVREVGLWLWVIYIY